jgi:hypothetical protein
MIARLCTAFLMLSLATCILSTSSAAQESISAKEAVSHVGENATVCGHVASTHFASTTRGRPTFINLDEPYPNQVFTVLIWGSERVNFGAPEVVYRNKNICATGVITSYRGSAEMTATSPSQVRIQ